MNNGVITNILLLISNSLLIPVTVLLLVFFLMTVMNLGGLISEYLERNRRIRHFQKQHHLPLGQIFRQTDHFLALNASIAKSLALFQEKPEDGSRILDDLQIHYEGKLMLLNIGIRLGPVLGLAGTLIPLGPALIGLSDGDIASLSQNLVVAFTTTVVGLFIGGLSYVVYTIRAHWYLRDMNHLEYFFDQKNESER